MITLCIRYTIVPNKLTDFQKYAKSELDVIRRNGGGSPSFFYPTDFAGPTSEALGLIDFETLSAYERYRGRLANDPSHERHARTLVDSGVIRCMNRSILERAESAIPHELQG